MRRRQDHAVPARRRGGQSGHGDLRHSGLATAPPGAAAHHRRDVRADAPRAPLPRLYPPSRLAAAAAGARPARHAPGEDPAQPAARLGVGLRARGLMPDAFTAGAPTLPGPARTAIPPHPPTTSDPPRHRATT